MVPKYAKVLIAQVGLLKSKSNKGAQNKQNNFIYDNGSVDLQNQHWFSFKTKL